MTDAGADIEDLSQGLHVSWLQLYCTFVQNMASSLSGWDCHSVQTRCNTKIQLQGAYFCDKPLTTRSQWRIAYFTAIALGHPRVSAVNAIRH